MAILNPTQPSASGGGDIPVGIIAMWSGSADMIPDGWQLCDGTNGTPNLEENGDILYIVKVFEHDKFVWWSPYMTSNATPLPYMVSASNTIEGSPYLAFNGKAQEKVNDKTAGYWYDVGSEKYLTFDFGTKTNVGGIEIAPFYGSWGNISPRQVKVMGSDDEISWKEVYYNFDENGESEIGVYKEHIFDKAVNYRYYRIEMDKNYANSTSFSNHISVSDIRFYREVI